MKRFIVFFLPLLLIISLCSCYGENNASSSSNPGQSSSAFSQGDQVSTSGEVSASESITRPASGKETLGVADFDELLDTLPLTIISTKYVIQDEQHKALFPDMLQAVLQNNTESDIKNACIAFVAWDSNNLPIKIKGQMDFSNGAYIKQVNYSDINLIPGETFGEDSGFALDADNRIASFKAIVVSFETFDGETWNNPYFSSWSKMYEGVKYDDSLNAEVEITDASFENSSGGSASINDTELISQIEEQDVRVISTQYVVQDEKYKSLYPDMLQAVISNGSELDIKNVVIAFVAWDQNGLPVKIKGRMDFSDGAYIKEVSCNDINLVPGETYGESSGYEIDESRGITAFKAIVVSYEAFSGKTWNNPLYSAWCKLYEGVKLQ